LIEIHAGLNIYNEAPFLEDVLRSIAWCDSITIVDGAYIGMQVPEPQSTDGTIEIIKKYKRILPIKFVEATKFRTRKQKINQMLSHMPRFEYLLRIDGDEVFKGDNKFIKEFINNTNLPLYTIPLYRLLSANVLDNHPYYVPRIVRITGDLKLTFTHLLMTNKFVPSYTLNPGGFVSPKEANLKNCKLIHYKRFKDPTRVEIHQKWQMFFARPGE